MTPLRNDADDPSPECSRKRDGIQSRELPCGFGSCDTAGSCGVGAESAPEAAGVGSRDR